MTVAFVDTTVLIDVLRNHPPSLTWANEQPRLRVSSIVAMELIYGAQDKQEQGKCIQLLKRFDLIYLNETDHAWAFDNLLRLRLGLAIQISDCLIASVCHRLQVPLYTGNLKHMRPLLGELAIKPY